MKRNILWSLVLGLAAILVSGAGPVWAADCGGPPTNVICKCGDRVVSDYDFPANLTCGDTPLEPFDGLIVEGVQLNLNGFRLTGTNHRGVGLLLRGAGGSVAHGRIQNFDVGIQSDGPTPFWEIGVADPLTVTNNRTGLDLITRNTIITDLAATSNLEDGLTLRGGVNTIVRITCSRNGDHGLYVIGANNSIAHNRCERNGGHGISVNGEDNVLIRNLGSNNGAAGVLAVGDGNSFQQNQAKANVGDGVRGVGTNLVTNGRNYGSGNGGVNCLIDGFTPTGGGRYC